MASLGGRGLRAQFPSPPKKKKKNNILDGQNVRMSIAAIWRELMNAHVSRLVRILALGQVYGLERKVKKL